MNKTFLHVVLTMLALVTFDAHKAIADDKIASPLLGVWVVDVEAVQDDPRLAESRKQGTFLADGVPFWSMHYAEIRPDSVVFSRDPFTPGHKASCSFEPLTGGGVRVVYKEEISWYIPLFEITIVDDDNIISHVSYEKEGWEIELPLKRVFRAVAPGIGTALPERLKEQLAGTWVIDEQRCADLSRVDDAFYSGRASAFRPSMTMKFEFDDAGNLVFEFVEGERLGVRLRDGDDDRWLLSFDGITPFDDNRSVRGYLYVDSIAILELADDGTPTFQWSSFKLPLKRIGDAEDAEPVP